MKLSVAGISTEVVRLGKGAPLLFLHGMDGLRSDMPFLNALAKTNEVWAPFHPGFGHSEMPQDFKTVEDLAYFYLDFIKEAGLSDVRLVGASFGGWIAAEIAVRSTANLKDLVLIDTVGARFGDRDQIDIVDIYMLDDSDLGARTFVDAARARLKIDELSDDDLLVISRNRVALCQYAWSPYLNNPRLKRWLHRIDVPTLVLWGEADRIVSTDYGAKFANAIPGAAFKTVPKAGHYPHVEQPDAVLEAIAEFKARRAA